MTTEILLVAISLITLGFIAFLFLKLRDLNHHASSNNTTQQLVELRQELQRLQNEQRQEMQTQLSRVNYQVYKGLNDSQRAMQNQFTHTSKIIEDITAKLTTLDSTNKQVLDFSSQLRSLQDILKNPKQRGVLGEYWLETLLRNILPPASYAMQYHLGKHEKTDKELIADAVIFVRNLIVPIDAKFSLENYNRAIGEQDSERREELERQLKADVKMRIDETAKYIQPQQGTMDFAFMFIPAEGVYYNLLNAEVGSGVNSQNLIEYAFSKKVMIVSPTSLFAYLQTVILGLNNLQIEENARDIQKNVAELGKHLRAYAEFHGKIGKNLAITVNQYNASSNDFKKISRDVVRVTDGDKSEIIEVEAVDRPLVE